MLIAGGHRYDDIRFKYTIAQVYLFAAKIKKIELDKDRMNAIVMSNCLMFSVPANDRMEARQKTKAFQQFLDSLVWSNLVSEKEEELRPKSAEDTIKKLFGGASIPIKIRKK